MVEIKDCIFCKIIKKEIPCQKIYQDNDFLAFLDVRPHVKGHTILIPKLHGETVFDFNDNLCEKIIPTVKKVMILIKKRLKCDGFNVGWNHTPFAGQVVPHLHLHIMPRYDGDGGGSMHSIINNPSKMSVEEVYALFG